MDLETEMVNVNVSTPTGGLSLDVKWGIMKVLTQIIKTIKKSEHKYRRNRINKIHYWIWKQRSKKESEGGGQYGDLEWKTMSLILGMLSWRHLWNI